ncbi:hypothetical protein Tco_1168202 [Tanacetum coccineum]
MLWDYLNLVIDNWNGKVVIMGDFNEVHKQAERYGSIFNVQGADAFNSFILAVGLEEVLLDKGEGNYDVLNKRIFVSKLLQELDKLESIEVAQKAKIKWAIDGDENSKYYHVQRVVDADMFRGISMGLSLYLSHIFYADDAVFMGHWSDSNIDTIIQVLECFYRASGSKVGGLMSRVQSWNEIVNNLAARLSNWKMKTLSIVPIKVLQRMESIHCHFFNGVDHNGIHGKDGKLGKNVNHIHPSIWLDIIREMEIYSLETCKKVTITVKTSHENMGYSLRQIPRGGIGQVQFLEFLTSMEVVALVDMRDSNLGVFLVKHAKEGHNWELRTMSLKF